MYTPEPVEGPRCTHPAPFVYTLRRPSGGRRVAGGHGCIQPARIASSSRATMLVILIIGFTAGPAVSL